MKTVLCEQLGPPEDLVVRDVDAEPVGPGQIAVDVKAAGVNLADTLIIRGRYQLRPKPPFAPGSEVAGVVSEVGDGVFDLRVGQRVCAFTGYGGFSERVVVDSGRAVPIPDAMDWCTAAGISVTYGTTHFALAREAELQAGESLLVLGASGGVGLSALEVGKALGARVIAAASSPEKLALCREHGADVTIDYKAEDLNERLRAEAPEGLSVVYDPVGGTSTDIALRRLAWRGRLLVIGFASGTLPGIRANLVLLKNARVLGIHWGAWVERDPAGHRETMQDLFEMWDAEQIRPLVSETFPLERAGDALRTILNREARGKLVLTMEQS